jgi:hypothetical protein
MWLSRRSVRGGQDTACWTSVCCYQSPSPRLAVAMNRVEVLSSSSDEDDDRGKATAPVIEPTPVAYEPSVALGPAKPPAGLVLKRAGRKPTPQPQVAPAVADVSKKPAASSTAAVSAQTKTAFVPPPLPATAPAVKQQPSFKPPPLPSASASVSQEMPALEEEQEPSSDSEDDLPPPLEPMPVHAKKTATTGE